MAKHFFHGKRRGVIVALSVALSATFSLGLFAACAGEPETPSEEEPPQDVETNESTDTQLLKNGNFEFYAEKEKAVEDKRAFINSPTNWRATSGSGSYASLTSSGIVNVDEWETITASNYSLVPDSALTDIADSNFKAKELTDEIISNATENWNKASVYDQLLFYKYYGVTSADQFAPYGDYTYSIDFEDVQYLKEDLGDSISVGSSTEKDSDDKNVLMIHNRQRYQSGNHKMHGAAQYYTSSTTISLEAGTAATVTVDVRTDKLLYGYVDDEHPNEVTEERGAYIGVTNTVGGQSQPEMQIKNINTQGEWQTYTIYIRANTFASTSFSIKLGLGQGNTDDRYELVDGYAFFDNVTVTKFLGEEYEDKIASIPEEFRCSIKSTSEEKIFSRDGVDKALTSYSLNLLSEDSSVSGKNLSPISMETLENGFGHGDNIGITTEAGTDRNKPYESLIKDNRNDGKTPSDEQSIVELTTYGDLQGKKDSNKYLTKIFADDFDTFPFEGSGEKADVPVLMMLSTNGAAYTAKLESDTFSLEGNSRMLVSFFVKTSSILSGRLGAGVTLVDGDNETSISSFDSTTVPAVDVNDDLTDIYDGWVQCFFIVANETDSPKSFSLKFTYGVTSVQGTAEEDYCNGYAAFTDFRTMPLNKTEYGFASTGSYAKKVSLTAIKANTSRFDTADAASDIEKDLANPSSFRESVAGQDIYTPDPDENSIFAGLINNDNDYKNVDAYKETVWGRFLTTKAANGAADAKTWWNTLFGEKSLIDPDARSQREARQPLVLVNTGADAPSHGYISRSLTASVSANSYYKISMRVKVSAGATAYLYLIDMDDTDDGYNKLITPSLPQVTFWYDDEGNILRCDPESDGFNKTDDTLYYRETNGLYTAAADAGKENKTYYANLYNYKRDGDNNYVTTDGTIAFYWHENKVYGHYDETDGTYSQEVHCLPTTDENNNSILHYDNKDTDNSKYQSVISVTGTPENQDQWITVSFYIHTGGKAKSYRVELWAGERTNETDGFPAESYIFFDGYSTGTTSDFATNRDAAVESLLKEHADPEDDEKLTGDVAKYYTFTFFDSADYLRHDRDFDGADYDKWQNYKQSSYSEGLLWLQYFDTDGTLAVNGAEGIKDYPSYALFLDFSLTEQSVSEYTPADNETPDEEPEEEEETSGTNIWLVLSSSILAVVTVLAVAAVVFRAVRKKVKKNAPVKIKEKKSKRVKVESAPAEPEGEEPKPEETKDESDPYND